MTPEEEFELYKSVLFSSITDKTNYDNLFNYIFSTCDVSESFILRYEDELCKAVSGGSKYHILEKIKFTKSLIKRCITYVNASDYFRLNNNKYSLEELLEIKQIYDNYGELIK